MASTLRRRHGRDDGALERTISPFAKYVAGREKDVDYTPSMARHAMVKHEILPA